MSKRIPLNFILIKKALFILFCSFFLVTPIFTQEVRDNFSIGSVYDIKKDNTGRIWLATNSGLYVSDGVNYIQINLGDINTTNSSIKQLIVEEEEIFIVFQDKGLIALNSSTLSFIKITDKPIASFFIEEHKKAFLLTKNGNLYTYQIGIKSNPKLQLLFTFENDQDNDPRMTFYSKDYLIVSLVNKGIFKINKNKWVVDKKYDIKPDGFNNSFSHLNDRLFFINKSELFELNQKDEFVKSTYIKSNQNISFVLPISTSDKIIIKSKKNLFLEKGDELIQFNLNKTKNYEISNALFISYNNIIFGSNQGIVKVFNQDIKTRSIYDSAVQLDNYINIRRKIIPYKENELLLLGFPKSHLYNLKTNQFTAITNKVVPLFDAVLVENTIYATSEGGGVKKIEINSKNITNIVTKEIDTTKLYGAILNIGFIIKDHLLIGRRGELILYNYKKKSSSLINLHNYSAKVNSIVVDSASKLIYVATSDGLYFYNVRTKAIIKKTHIKGKIISDLAILNEKDKSILWYISDVGLTSIDLSSNKILSHKDIINFENARLTSILVDAKKKVWVSSYNGIYAYQYPINNFIKLNSKNGLINQEFNYKSAALLSNGQLIFGGLNGYDLIQSNLYNYSGKPSRGTILGYSIYGLNKRIYKHFDISKIVEYNTSNYYLELYFSMENFQNFKLTEFEYKIDEGAWIPLLGLSYLYMYNLKDGLHTISIRGWDESGNPVNFDTITINQYTDFFQSTSFRYFLFFIVIILLIVTGFIYYYNNRELNRIKSNIAMDLHDEIGTILNRTLFTIKDDEILSKNTNLINYLSEALFSIRTYIITFNKTKISILQLFDEIKEHAINYFKISEIDYSINYKVDEDIEINNYVYRDLKLIFYEINQNILKHSNAKSVKANIYFEKGDLVAIIQDDGMLTNIEFIEKKGNGVTNIRKRIERINGKVKFDINPDGHGLLIEIKLNFA